MIEGMVAFGTADGSERLGHRGVATLDTRLFGARRPSQAVAATASARRTLAATLRVSTVSTYLRKNWDSSVEGDCISIGISLSPFNRVALGIRDGERADIAVNKQALMRRQPAKRERTDRETCIYNHFSPSAIKPRTSMKWMQITHEHKMAAPSAAGVC